MPASTTLPRCSGAARWQQRSASAAARPLAVAEQHDRLVADAAGERLRRRARRPRRRCTRRCGAASRGLPCMRRIAADDKSTLRPAEAPRELSRAVPRPAAAASASTSAAWRIAPRSPGKMRRSTRPAPSLARDAEIDEADRLLRRAAARAGDAGDRHREIDAGARRTAPRAIAAAVSALIAPCAAIVSRGTPSSSILASFE